MAMNDHEYTNRPCTHLTICSNVLFKVCALCDSNSLSGPQAWTVMGKLLPGRQPKIRNHT